MQAEVRLLELLKQKSFSKGKIKLSSGKISPYYLDTRLTTLDPEGSFLVGNIIYERIRDLKPDAIGGLTLGADPIVSAVSLVSYLKNDPIPAFIVRKSEKEHGKMKLIEGCFEVGYKVIIVEDVLTTGSSAYKAVQAVEQAGGKVLKVIAIIDRQEGGRQFLLEKGYPFEALYLRSDFISDEELNILAKEIQNEN